MMKIDRTPYVTDDDVQKLINANLIWDNLTKWTWHVKIGGQKFEINKRIKPVLLRMTKDHCAFCDYLVSADFFEPSIEHFEPKSKYPIKAYLWENLFPSCYGCNKSKDDQFSSKLLKPDEDTYTFNTYFTVTGDGKIEPSLVANEMAKKRAEVTIDIYKLNNRGTLLSERKKYLQDYLKLAPFPDEENRPFRFLIPIAEEAENPDAIINNFLL